MLNVCACADSREARMAETLRERVYGEMVRVLKLGNRQQRQKLVDDAVSVTLKYAERAEALDGMDRAVDVYRERAEDMAKALAEQRERWGHVRGCRCGLETCDEAMPFACVAGPKRAWPHRHIDNRCAPQPGGEEGE